MNTHMVHVESNDSPCYHEGMIFVKGVCGCLFMGDMSRICGRDIQNSFLTEPELLDLETAGCKG